MNSSVEKSDSDAEERKSQEEMKDSEIPEDDGPAEIAAKSNYFGTKPRKKKGVIDLKDLRENDFLDLIAAKNQDKRFYGWLHMHPLFDDDWSSSGGARSHHEELESLQGSVTSGKVRRTSAAFNKGTKGDLVADSE